MNVQAWSQNLTKDRCAEVGVDYVDRETLFALPISFQSTLNYLTVFAIWLELTNWL